MTSTDSISFVGQPQTPGRLLKAACVAIAFCCGLVVVVLGIDFALGRQLAKHHHLIGAEVYDVTVDRISKPDRQVRDLYFGDSVARELFSPGQEKDPRVCRYLTTNQAIGLSGQYYLLRDALKSFSNTRRVFLFYTPRSWGNDLDGPLGLDYFCQYFHKPDEISEVFRVKRDVSLTTAQAERWLLPNLIATNRELTLRLQSVDAVVFNTPERAKETKAVAEISGPAGEPILRAGQKVVDYVWPHNTFPIMKTVIGPIPPRPIPMSPISTYFLAKIRKLCNDRHLALHVVPCPCISDQPWVVPPTPYDSAIWYLPPEEFIDGIHIKFTLLAERRAQFIARYQLPGE